MVSAEEPSDHLTVLQRKHPPVVPAPGPTPLLVLLEQRGRSRRPRGHSLLLTLRSLQPRVVVEVGASVPAALGAARAVSRKSQGVRLLLLTVVVVVVMELLHGDRGSPAYYVVVSAKDVSVSFEEPFPLISKN